MEIVREGKAATKDNAADLYKMDITPQDAAGNTVMRNASIPGGFMLRANRNDVGMLGQPGTFDYIGTPYETSKEMYINYSTTNGAYTPCQGQIATVRFLVQPMFEVQGAKVTCRIIQDDNKSIEVKPDNGNAFYVPHTGGFTDTDGTDLTKVEFTIHPNPNIEGAKDKTYTYKIWKVPTTDVQLANIVVRMARVADGQGQALLDPATGEKIDFNAAKTEYNINMDYNADHVYVVPTPATPDAEVKYTVNGVPTQPVRSLNANGLDAVLPIGKTGDAIIKAAFGVKGNAQVQVKEYTLNIKREPNLNVDLAFSDNVDIVNGMNLKRMSAVMLGYDRDQTTFTVTAKAEDSSRTVSLAQKGKNTVTADGQASAEFSLYEEVVVTVTDKVTGKFKEYTVSPHAFSLDGPTSTYALLPAPGQFMNGGWSGFDSVRVVGAIGAPSSGNAGGSGGGSLGTFGGYVTYYYADTIKNGPNNSYGADFMIAGNAFMGNNEPAAIRVAQDKDKDGKPDTDKNGEEIWYDLAGSMHYEDSTIWDYEITYNNPNPQFMPFVAENVPYTDNKGGSGFAKANGFHSQAYYPDPELYLPGENNAEFDSETMTLHGVKLDAMSTGGRVIPTHFGYADCTVFNNKLLVEAGNPYAEDQSKFDLDWAVDKDGNPVHLDEVSFICIYSATLYDQDATGEISPEIMGIWRLDKAGNAPVGRTNKPESLVLKADGFDDIVISGKDVPENGAVLEVNVGDRQYIRTVVNGKNGQKMFVNNYPVRSGGEEAPYMTASLDNPRLVRVIAQEGEKEAYICLLKLQSSATEADTVLTGLKVMRNGADVSGLLRKGVFNYELTVPSNYSTLQIVPTVKDNATVTVNGQELDKNGYTAVQLNGPGTQTLITITAALEGITETTELIVTRNSSGGSDKPQTGTAYISVEKFTLGQGYIVEPTKVTFNIGDTAADITKELLGEENYQSTNTELGFYLSDVRDPKRGTPQIPQYVLDALDKAGVDLNMEDTDPDWLGEFDYTPTSGWMITVNNKFIPVGSGAWKVKDGDVIRWQFTVYGLGADLGNSSPDSEYGGQKSLLDLPNKDLLTQLIAMRGADKVSEEVLATATKLNATKAEVDEAVKALQSGSGNGGGGTTATTKPTDPTTGADNKTGFVDVKTGDWFYDAVKYAKDNGLMNGEENNRFNPNNKLNRAMLVTILYRLEKEPNAAAGSFADVAAGQWYAKAVAWASANGIVKGYEDGNFRPLANISREEFAAVLMRYAEFKKVDVTKTADLSGYKDCAKVSAWAKDNLAWANAVGLIKGDDNNNLNPQGAATRAEAATILMRLSQDVLK